MRNNAHIQYKHSKLMRSLGLVPLEVYETKAVI